MEDHKLQLFDLRRDIILVIGRSGVGKSTITEIMFGDVSALEATFDEDLLCYKIKDTREAPGDEERSMFQSDTVCPQVFVDPEVPDFAVYDCPGFADTRGTSNEIATGVYLSEIAQHADRVKLVVAVDYDSVKPNADRSKFTDAILPEVLDFVLNNDIYDGGVFLLVTKYTNPLETSNTYDDDTIVRSIAYFLKEAQKCAVRNSTDENRKSAINALLDNSWLKTDGGKYPNIGFSRTITSEGKLCDMESLTRRTQLRSQLLDNPFFVFKPSNPAQFGCPISEAAKLEIRKVQSALGEEANLLLKTVGQKLVKKFIESARDHANLSRCAQQYALFLKEKKELTEEESGFTLRSLEVLRKFGNTIEADIETEMNKLEETVKRMKYLSAVDIEESSAIWKDAHSSWNRAIQNMDEDTLMESRNFQKELVSEANQLWKLLSQRAVIQFAQSNVKTHFDQLQAFCNKPAKLTGRNFEMTDKSLEILREFAAAGVDMQTEIRQLEEIIGCLQHLTEADAEQSLATWSEVNKNRNDVIAFMEKDMAQIRVKQAEFDQEVQQKLDAAKAAADLAATKSAAALAAAKAAAVLAATNSSAKLRAAWAERDAAVLQERTNAKTYLGILTAEISRLNPSVNVHAAILAADRRERRERCKVQ